MTEMLLVEVQTGAGSKQGYLHKSHISSSASAKG